MLEWLNVKFGLEIKISGEKRLKGIPNYMVLGRKIYEAECLGIPFLLVSVSDTERFGSIALKNQLEKYQKVSGRYAAYYFDSMTIAQRYSLVKKRIAFLYEPNQVYLPFMGVIMQERLKSKPEIRLDKMMPATQAVFLYLLYNGRNGCLKKDVADNLGITRMSVTRASAQLFEMKLIHEEKSGREIRMYPVVSGIEYYHQAKPYLIDPVIRRVYVDRGSFPKSVILSGDSALSQMTMLSVPGIPVYAVEKNDDIVKDLKIVDPKWEQDCDVAVVELWKYNPQLFARNNAVDPVSLAESLKDADERVEKSIDEYMEKWEW